MEVFIDQDMVCIPGCSLATKPVWCKTYKEAEMSTMVVAPAPAWSIKRYMFVCSSLNM